MFDTNILNFQDNFHIMQILPQDSIPGMHHSVLCWRIPKSTWEGFVASKAGGRLYWLSFSLCSGGDSR